MDYPYNHTASWTSPKLPLQIVVTRAPDTHWIGGWVTPELMVHKRDPSTGHLGTITAVRFAYGLAACAVIGDVSSFYLLALTFQSDFNL